MTTTQMVVGSEAIFPNITTRGLFLNLDGTNPSSYPGSGSTWFDLSGNGYNATLQNSPTYDNTDTSVGLGSFNFNGVDQWVLSASMPTHLATGTPNTIEVWAKNTNVGGTVVGFQATATPNTGAHRSLIEFCFVGPFYTVRWYQQGTSGSTFGAIGNQNPPANQWNQYVITSNNSINQGFQGPTPTTTLGTPTIGAAVAGTASYSGSAYLQFAHNDTTNSGATGSGNWFAGRIGIVRAYNRILTTTEIRQNYNATRAYYGL